MGGLTIFSSADVEDLVQLFKPSTGLESTVHHERLDPAALLPSESGKGFLAFSNVQRRLNDKVMNDIEERIEVSAVSQMLDINETTVLEILQKQSPATLISGDKRYILPTYETQKILKQLLDSTAQGLISKTRFLKDNDISPDSSDALIAPIGGFLQLERSQSKELYLTTITYQKLLDQEILDILQASQKEGWNVNFADEKLTGRPPVWFLSERLDHLLKQDPIFRGRIGHAEDSITYKPESFLINARDNTIAQLRKGSLTHVHLARFVEELPDLYKTVEDVQAYFQECLGDLVSFASGYAISELWLEGNRNIQISYIASSGYSDVALEIKVTFPEVLQADILAIQMERTTSMIEELPDAENVSSLNSFLVREDYLNELTEFVLSSARERARAKWTQLEQSPEKECALVAFDVYQEFCKDPTCAYDGALFRAVLEKNEGHAKSAFAEKIAELEVQNEADFALFWSDRVMARFHVYRTGAEAVADPKLQTQLLELLQSHITKDLVPESLAKAQTKGLMRSKKTKKHTARFSTTLKSASDLQSLSSTLDKFGHKQGIASPSPSALTEKKSAQLKELIRGMKKDNDGPRLFLTLVVVLLANRAPGIVYATGKFAPKLMKLLRGELGEEQYERLERWKDAVKAGSLTTEDRAGMRALAMVE